MSSRSPVCLASFLAAAALAGCASPPPGQRHEAHGRIALPADPGATGISFSQPVPEFHVRLPANRREASGEFAAELVRNPDPQAGIALPAIYVLGRLIGSSFGVSESTLAPARDQAAAAVADFPAREFLDGALRRTLDRHGVVAPVGLEEGLPVEPRQRHGRITTDGKSRLTWVSGTAEPHPLQGSSIATLVGLRVVHQGLRARPSLHSHRSVQGPYGELNPPLVLELAVEISAVRVEDWTSYGNISVQCAGGPRRFTEWAADDARLLRQELAAAWAAIARELSTRLVPTPAAPVGFRQ